MRNLQIGVNLVEKVLINLLCHAKLIMSCKVNNIMSHIVSCLYNQHNLLLVKPLSYTLKQIDLTSVFVTIAVLLCQHVIINKPDVQMSLLFGTASIKSFLRKQIKTKLIVL